MDVKQFAISLTETVVKILAVVILIMFVYDTAAKAYDYGYRVFAEEPVSMGEGRTISVYVKEEYSVREVGEMLESKGLIRDASLFVVQEFLSEYHGKITPGIYDLNTSMSVEEMLEIMSAASEEEGQEDDS